MQGVTTMAKGHQFNFRLDDEDQKNLDRLAEHYGETSAEVVRMLIRRDAEAVFEVREEHRLVHAVVSRLHAKTLEPVPMAMLASAPVQRELADLQRVLFPRARLDGGIARVLDDLVRWGYLKLTSGSAYATTRRQPG